MVSGSTPVFSAPVFNRSEATRTNVMSAAQGFAQILTSMLARQLRQSLGSTQGGPLGINGDSAGDIYASFLDQALGRTLSESGAMKPFNEMIVRALRGLEERGKIPPAGPRAGARLELSGHLVRLARRGRSLATVAAFGGYAHARSGAYESAGAGFNSYSGLLTSDRRGPVLPPPPPPESSILLPPPRFLYEELSK